MFEVNNKKIELVQHDEIGKSRIFSETFLQ